MAANRENLWPFAINYTAYMHNHLPISNIYISPTEHFTSTIFPNYNHLTRAHTFGYPVYVLDPRLQESKKVPKWSVRSRRGIYIGVSKHHSSTVNLVLNPETGVISPQYHCVFNDIFSIVWSDGQFDPTIWECLVQQVDRHFTVEPGSNGHATLPNDFIPFAPDIPTRGGLIPQSSIPGKPSLQAHPNNPGTNTAPITTQLTSTPILTRQMPTPSTPTLPPTPALPPPTPTLAPAPALPAVPPTIFQLRRSTKSNFGQPPELLDPSGHIITQYTEATDHLLAPPNTSLVQHYYPLTTERSCTQKVSARTLI